MSRIFTPLFKSPFPRKLLLTITLYSLFFISKSKTVTNNFMGNSHEQHDLSTLKSNGLFGNGVNLQPSYYNQGNVSFGWSYMKQYDKIKTVRIEIEPDKVYQAKDWIFQAQSNGYHVIATYHKCSVLGTNDPNELLTAANWWKENYDILASFAGFTINLMNEWGNHDITVNEYSTAYNAALKIIRQFYPGLVIIDIPGWGQETTIAAAAIKGIGSVKISDKNIVLSAHIYPKGWNQIKGRFLERSDIEELNSTERPCIIGEFGGLVESGPVDVVDLVTYAKSLGWSAIGWTWNGDGGELNMVTPSWATEPYPSSLSPSSYFNRIYDLL